MARNRNSATKASDRQAVARMLLEGQSIRTIADTLGRSTATIQSDVNELRREWTTSARESMREHLALELARLGHVERSMYRELDRLNDPAERLAGYEKIGKLVCRRCDVLGLKNLADVSKATTELEESYLEIKQAFHYALAKTLPQDGEVWKRFQEFFRNFDPAEEKAKALAEMESAE